MTKEKHYVEISNIETNEFADWINSKAVSVPSHAIFFPVLLWNGDYFEIIENNPNYLSTFIKHESKESFKAVFENNPQYEQVFTLKQMEDCFNEARLMHPMIGFKHKDFNEYKSTIQELNPIELTNPKK